MGPMGWRNRDGTVAISSSIELAVEIATVVNLTMSATSLPLAAACAEAKAAGEAALTKIFLREEEGRPEKAEEADILKVRDEGTVEISSKIGLGTERAKQARCRGSLRNLCGVRKEEW
jgi:hypothetical protein